MRRQKPTSLSIPPPLLEWVDNEAALRNVNRSAFICRLLSREQDGELSRRVTRLENILNRIAPNE